MDSLFTIKSNKAPAYRFIAFILLMLPQLFIYSGVQIIPSLGSEIMDYLNIAEQQLSFASSIATIAKAVSAFFAGLVASKYGGRKTVITGLIIMFFSGIMFFGIPMSFPVLCIARVIQGIGCGIANTCLVSMVCSWFPKSERGVAQGIISGLAGSGISVAEVYAYKCSNIGLYWYETVGCLFSVGGGLLLLLIVFFYKDIEAAYGIHNIDEALSGGGAAESAASEKIRVSGAKSWTEIIKRKEFWLLEGAVFFSGASTLSIGFIEPLFLASCGYTPAEKTSIMSLGAFSAIIFSIGGGYVSGKVFKTRRCESIIIGYGLAAIFSLLLFIFAPMKNTALSTVIYFFAFGLIYFGMGPKWTLVSEIVDPAFSSRCVGASFLLSGLGGFAATNVLGFITENFGINAAESVHIFFTAAVAFFICLMRKEHKY